MKREYTKPTLVLHGDMAVFTQALGCENSDDGIGSNNALPNPTPSGVPRVCI
jgi:hypothetical protein